MSDSLFSNVKKRVQDEAVLLEARQVTRPDTEQDTSEGSGVAGGIGGVGGTGSRRRPLSYQQPIPDDLWIKCPACGGVMFREDFENANQVCTLCHHHFRINAWERIWLVVDQGSFVELDKDVRATNPIDFAGYEDKTRRLQAETGLNDAVVTGRATIEGVSCLVGAMDSRFIMGSMGAAVGEKIIRLFERGTSEKLPVVLFTVSGGARMQEGIVSLMQMASTSAAVAKHSAAGQLYIAFMTDPTTGGVTASFASLGDIILSEPGSIIGFAGRRVIEGTISEKLPDDFQHAEFQESHGFLDGIIPRSRIRATLGSLLAFHCPGSESESRVSQVMKRAKDRSDEELFPAKVARSLHDAPPVTVASESLDLIRAKGRPNIIDYLPLIFDSFYELKGDRLYGEDPAIWGGLGILGGEPVTIIAERKGRNLEENNLTKFGMPHPEGYRKALRLMKQAEKFGRPVLTFVDTSGAYCGVGAEERGQGSAIAVNLAEMSRLQVPIVTVVIGEGGSGGALGIAVADRVAMLSNAIYSVISPRGFASLLWKDASREREAADVMHITARDLLELGITDGIIVEPGAGAHEHAEETAAGIKKYFLQALAEIKATSPTIEALLENRYNRYTKLGPYWQE